MSDLLAVPSRVVVAAAGWRDEVRMSDLLSELRDAVTVDFESAPITPRPQYPPEPVGVAIKIGAQPSRYYAWAHPAQNNTTRERALAALTKVWTGRRPLLMHHAKFDLAVGIEKLGLPMPTVPIHDTMPQLFLRDPRAVTFALKPSAHAILGLAPEERDAVEDWLMEHQPIPGVKISRAPKSPHYVGAYIGSAPGNLVATYACGDTDRTYGLAQVLGQHLATTGMVAAYAREQALLPTIMGMERFGVRVDLPRLLVDCERTERVIATVDAWIFHHLKSTPFNLDAKGELVQALLAGGAATAASLGSTKTGKIATNKAALAQGVTDPPLMAMLRYRGALCHSLRTYMRPWVETAQQSGGRIFTTWHSTRSDESGARTGRFSSTPNFQNCFSGDTELLTGNGWVRFDQLQRGVPVAQYDAITEEISFVAPMAYVQQPGDGTLLHVRQMKQVDLLMTPGHEQLLRRRTGEVFKVSAAEIPSDQQFLHAGHYAGGAEAVPAGMVTLLCAAQADGHWNGSGWVFSFKKKRKADRLLAALNALGACFSEHHPSSGYYQYYLMGDFAYALRERLGSKKEFGAWLLRWNRKALDQFMEEIMLWDGLSTRRTCYFSNNRNNVDWAQIVAVLSGRRARIRAYEAKSGNTNWQADIPFRGHSWTTNLTKTTVPYTGDVYCVTMPAGNIIVRRNGRAVITGNCVKVVPDVFARGDSAFIAPMPRGLKLPPLPYVRSYIVPEPGHVLIDRDYASQELRILAHFEDGAMLRAYRDDQWIDVHEHARISLSVRVGREFKRGEIKTISFGMIYGLGVTGLARKLGVSMDEARQAKDAYLATFPGLRELYQVMRDRAKVRAPITTWGGRQYYCEQAKEVDGRARTMDYKLVNVLIQGSAADCTKEAIRRYAAVKPADHHPLLLVHDEVVVSVPADECAAGMELLRQSMESVQFDVPMLSEGKWSQKNWGSLEDYDAKGQRIELEAA